jgi:eukaryotic-like serine/threonine-protein kinase
MQRDSDAGPVSDTAVTFADFDRPDVSQDRSPRATLSAAVTLVRAFGAEASEPRFVDPHEGAQRSFDPGTRYENRRVLGEGGMGEVRLCADSFVGREVAMKVIRGGGGTFPDAQKRFLREARVQGQLEHPAIVPVYDIGVTSAHETFFTMKRIVGRTLEEIISGLARGDETLISRFPLRKLLSAFTQVTLALAFAHSKGVVHRDLKPANIMLGDFGEVYVLDWGIAKVATSDDLPSPSAKESETHVAGTQAGALLGTPGYMSPEQARGESSACDHRADIYALGAILYEVLALAPMHRSKSLAELVVAAMSVDGARPSSERTDVSSVLDGICYRATRLDPNERFESARELHDALESFLDGERDRERRQEIADVHTSRAEELLRQPDDEGDSEARRTEIMRELGSALILDPAHRRARRALLQVLVDEPETIPPDAERELDDINRKDRAQSALGAALTYLGWFLLLPIGMWMGIQKPLWVIALGATNLLFVGFMIWM